MTVFYDITTVLRDSLKDNPNVTTVSEGSIFDIDLNKKTLFPLSHVNINSITHEGAVLRVNVSVFCMDIVNVSKDQTKDVFKGNDDTHDVLNTQAAVALKVVEDFKRGDNYGGVYQIDGEPILEPWTDRFENLLAGWTCTFDVLYANSMTIC